MNRIFFIKIFFIVILFIVMNKASAADGMINVQSVFDVNRTADRLQNTLNEKGMTIFNRINHGKSAADLNIDIGNSELIIFGNPKLGSLLIQCQRTIAIDLPLKALIWQDDTNKVWISYNDPKYLAQRHALTGCDKIITQIDQALNKIVGLAASN